MGMRECVGALAQLDLVVARCLQVVALRVTGPRYWHQLLAQQSIGGRGPSLAALYATRTLFVQRKGGALPYADDPSGESLCMRRVLGSHRWLMDSCFGLNVELDLLCRACRFAGVRSLLSRMVHHGGNNSSASEDSFDLVNLCSTFGSDPFVMSFAQARLRCGVCRCEMLSGLGRALQQRARLVRLPRAAVLQRWHGRAQRWQVFVPASACGLQLPRFLSGRAVRVHHQ